MATRGPSGGGHRPRVRSSGGDIAEPVSERLEHMALFDLGRAVQVGRGPGYPPGAMKAAGGHTSLDRPALQGAARRRRQAGELPEARGLELGVEAALAGELPAPRPD